MSERDRMGLSDLIRIASPVGIPWTVLLASVHILLIALARPLGPSRFGAAVTVSSILVVAASVPIALSANGAEPRTSTRTSVAAVVNVSLFLHVDLLISWVGLPAREAGLYAGAAVLSRWLVIVPALWALTLRRSTWAGERDPFQWLHRSLATTGPLLVVSCISVSLFRTPLVDGVLGGAYDGATTLVPTLAVTAALLAIIWELSFIHLAVASRAHIMLLVVTALEVIGALSATSTDRLAAIAVAGAAAGALFQYVGARAVTRWSPPLSELRPHRELATASSRTDDDIELSLILPCYNPGPGLRPFLTRLVSELQDEGRFELIVVSDGSTDDSVEVARKLDSPSIRVLHYTEQAGKGHALRVGLRAARGAFIGFIDADGDIDPQAVGPFVSLMRLYGPDIVLGSKRHPMSEVSYPPMRRLMSWIYHKLTRALFRINVRDTQTGLKLVRRDVLVDVLPRMFEKRYAFDLELLVVARLLGYTKVFEAPVKIDYRFSSNVDPDAVLRILLDTAAIFYRRYILDTYRYAGGRLLIVRGDEVEPEVGAGIG